MSTRPRKRARPWVKRSLGEGAVIVGNPALDGAASVRIGLAGGASITLQVSPVTHPGQPHRRDFVQIQLSLYNAYDEPLGHSIVAGHRMPQLAWAFLDTRSGELSQEQPYAEA